MFIHVIFSSEHSQRNRQRNLTEACLQGFYILPTYCPLTLLTQIRDPPPPHPITHGSTVTHGLIVHGWGGYIHNYNMCQDPTRITEDGTERHGSTHTRQRSIYRAMGLPVWVTRKQYCTLTKPLLGKPWYQSATGRIWLIRRSINAACESSHYIKRLNSPL